MIPITDTDTGQGVKQEKPDSIQSLEMMGRITDTKIQTRELISDFVLLTFDLPTTKEGNAARYEFYKAARRAGMVSHTESVYFGPANPESEAAIFEVASKGNAFIWYSRVPEKEAILLTKTYDAALGERFKEVEARLTKISLRLEDGNKLGMARKMLEGTKQMIDTLVQAATYRGSQSLIERGGAVREWYETLDRLLPERKLRVKKAQAASA